MNGRVAKVSGTLSIVGRAENTAFVRDVEKTPRPDPVVSSIEALQIGAPASLVPIYRIALIANKWFDNLPENIRRDVLSRGKQRLVASGQVVFSRGDEHNGLYRVLEGCVRLSSTSQEGRGTVLDLYGPGIWFGEVSALDCLPRQFAADAIERASLIHVAQTDLEELLATHPKFSRALLRLEALRLRLLLTAIEEYSVQSLEHRLANRLLMLSVPHGVGTSRGLKINLRLSQEILAELIGATRQRVNQILKCWEAEGIVEQRYGHVLLVDQKALQECAEM